MASKGDAIDFGDLTPQNICYPCGSNNGTRGIFAAGITLHKLLTIDYITIATTGNAVDFGDLTCDRRTVVVMCMYSNSCSFWWRLQ